MNDKTITAVSTSPAFYQSVSTGPVIKHVNRTVERGYLGYGEELGQSHLPGIRESNHRCLAGFTGTAIEEPKS